MNICVFCSASDVAEKYTRPAAEFGSLLGKNGHVLVWGGSNKGTMKVVAGAAQAAGGKIIGVSVEFLKDAAHKNADEMIFEQGLVERKATMLKRSEVFLVMPGGLGTLDEVTEILELKKHGVHNKPVVMLNTDGFFDGFKAQLVRMDAEGFLPRPLNDLIYFAESPVEAMRYIESHGN